jgi:hypothetical protein
MVGDEGSRLRIVDRVGRAQDRWKWRWKGAGVDTVQFLEPETDADAHYNACVYSGTAPTAAVVDVAADGAVDCGERACWHRSESAVLRYYDPSTTRIGPLRLRLRARAGGLATISVVSAGPSVDAFELPLALPLTVQLTARSRKTRHCWESRIEQARSNTATLLSAGGPEF